MSDTTTCAIVGGGPAGLFLGLLLARAGVEVTVLEKHADFLRDFRGDTVHPVTLRLLDELGLFDQFDSLPHSIVEKGQFDVDGHLYTLVDFRRLRQPHPYVAMVPQWDLLDLIAETAGKEPTFTLRMRSEVTGLLRDGNAVTGVRYTGPDGPGELRADLTVGCDGRTSVVRRDAGLPIREYPVPFDVWWFRAAPRPERAILVDPPHQARAGAGDDPSPGLLPDRVPDSQGQRRGVAGSWARVVSPRTRRADPRIVVRCHYVLG